MFFNKAIHLNNSDVDCFMWQCDLYNKVKYKAHFVPILNRFEGLKYF